VGKTFFKTSLQFSDGKVALTLNKKNTLLGQLQMNVLGINRKPQHT
jgi:hypothetical protein